MTMEKRANRVNTTRLVRDMVNDFYDSLRRAKEEGRLVCWGVGPITYTPLLTMDIAFLHLENYATLCSGRKGEKEMLDAAEAAGYSRDVCSYLRIGNGSSLLSRSGRTDISRPELLMPEPDFIYCIPICPTMTNWYESLLKIYNCPSFYVDIPMAYNDDEVEENIRYVARQLRDFIQFLEDISHRKFDWERFKYLVGLVREGSRIKKECFKLCQHIPSPMSQFDWFISLAPANILRGRERSVEYWKLLKAELEDRVARGIGAVPEEKYRLYWDHIAVWFRLRDLSEWFAAHDACVVAGNYVNCMFYPEPEEIEPEHPLETLARERCATLQMVRNLDYRINIVGKLIEEFRIDGMVVHASRTCRPLALGQYDLVDAIGEKYGIPGIVLEGDHCDPSLYSDAEWHDKLESFLEMVDARKKERLVA